MPRFSRADITARLLPLFGALFVGAMALLLVWWLQRATQVESYDPAKHDRVRVVTVDTAKQKECLDRYPAEQRRTEGYLRCTEGFVYEQQQDFFIDKRPADTR
jgi:hypothetical protein